MIQILCNFVIFNLQHSQSENQYQQKPNNLMILVVAFWFGYNFGGVCCLEEIEDENH